MDSWRDHGVSFNQEVTRTRSNSYRKPPLGENSDWQQSIPSWEKKFCTSVGSIPWKKFVEAKKFIHLYDNVIKWNDSASKEAFDNAKNKFYANLHGLPCNKPSPDPDIYIDKIDWNSQLDPNLILDLECDLVCPDSSSKNKEQVVIFGSSFPPSYQNFSPYGWGDSDDDKKKELPGTSPQYNTGQLDVEENKGGVFDSNDSWRGWIGKEQTTKGDEGWGENRNDYWGWNVYDNNNYFYGDVNQETRDGGGRYKTSRFRKVDSQVRKNGNGRKSSGSKAWNSCGPVHPGAPVHRWSVKKPVS